MSRFSELPFVSSIGTAYHKQDTAVLENLTDAQWGTVKSLIHAGISHGRQFGLEEDCKRCGTMPPGFQCRSCGRLA